MTPYFENTSSSLRRDPYLIGVAGGTASGKTSVCNKIIETLGDTRKRVVIISQDSFYRNLEPEELKLATSGDYNFDHPQAFDDALFKQVLMDLKAGSPVSIPHYNFVTHSRDPDQAVRIENVDVVLIEGILVFYDPEIRELFDMKIFVDTDSDIRLARRVRRDLEDRGRNICQILHQYTTFVKPAFDEFCFQTKRFADIIIPRGADNTVAIELLVQRIHEILRSPRSSSTSSLDDDNKIISLEKHLNMEYVDRDGKPCKACFSFEEMMKQSQKFSKKKVGEKVEEKLESRRKDCPVDKDELGRSTWNLLHTMAAYYPENPREQEKKDMKDTIHSMSKTYPCVHCAEDFREDLKQHPPVLDNKDSLSKWMCEMHNRVNVKIGKEVFDCTKFIFTAILTFMKRVEKNLSERDRYYLEKQSSIESTSSDEVEYGPDTEFVDTCKRMFSLGKPATPTLRGYPAEKSPQQWLNKNAIVPFVNSRVSNESFPLKLVSASLLELFLSTLPIDKRDEVKTVLIQMLTAGGFLSRKVFSDQYATTRSALVSNMSAYVVNIAREFVNGLNSSPRVDDPLKLTGPFQFEKFVSRYDQDFEEIKAIGAGGFGKVFHSKSRVDNQHYAIKKICLKESTEKCSQRMLDECRFHAGLQHPNVVRYHNAWFEITINEVPKINSGHEFVKTLSTTTTRPLVANKWVSEEVESIIYKTLYIQMELCHFTLEKYMMNRLKDQRIDQKFNEVVVEGLLSAVDFLHRNHVVHRDIKPSNIMMKVHEGKTNVLLGDFGLAKEINEFALNESSSKKEGDFKAKLTSGLGTFLYAAPEQLHSKDYSFSADIYSCGIVIYELYELFSTKSERAHRISELRENGRTTDEFRKKWPKLYPIIEQMVHEDADLRPNAMILLKNFRSWQARKEQGARFEEIEDLKRRRSFWENKYKNLKQKLLEKGLMDLLSDSEEELM
ncbi:hypothetical protein FO519_006178 [Halicephalobus sp. NKZ332]|nr:hypothetical protein FO519_006178 [Halicephalobus sp. NKZ332]